MDQIHIQTVIFDPDSYPDCNVSSPDSYPYCNGFCTDDDIWEERESVTICHIQIWVKRLPLHTQRGSKLYSYDRGSWGEWSEQEQAKSQTNTPSDSLGVQLCTPLGVEG